MGCIRDVDYKASLACSKNWGSPGVPFDRTKDQLSYLLEAVKPLNARKDLRLSLGLSGDRGGMYGNNFALLLGIRYSGNFSY
jgi:hypothetical protein